jgi:hypothetical protein
MVSSLDKAGLLKSESVPDGLPKLKLLPVEPNVAVDPIETSLGMLGFCCANGLGPGLDGVPKVAGCPTEPPEPNDDNLFWPAAAKGLLWVALPKGAEVLQSLAKLLAAAANGLALFAVEAAPNELELPKTGRLLAPVLVVGCVGVEPHGELLLAPRPDA